MNGQDITPLLERVRTGDADARSRLWERVEREVRAIASHALRRENKAHRMETTAVVDEAYLRLFGEKAPAFEHREHLFGAVARIVAEILIGEARRRRRRPKPVDPDALLGVLDEAPTQTWTAEDFAAVDAAIDRLEEDPRHERKANVLRMQYFGGLSLEKIAELLELSRDSVKRDLRLGRAWIYRELTRRKGLG